jgi:CxxC motif-containing protein
MTNPQRSIASSILLEGGVLPLVSVRLSKPIPKNKILAVMAVIKKTRLQAPVSAGQLAIANVLGLGSDVIVTKHVAAR